MLFRYWNVLCIYFAKVYRQLVRGSWSGVFTPMFVYTCQVVALLVYGVTMFVQFECPYQTVRQLIAVKFNQTQLNWDKYLLGSLFIAILAMAELLEGSLFPVD